MNQQDRARALEAIGLMLAGFPSSQSSITEATADAYMAAVSHCPIAGIEAACAEFLKGQVGNHDNNFPPPAPKLAAMAHALGEAARSLSEGPRLVSYKIGEQPPPGYVPLGAKNDAWRGPSKTKFISQK